MKVSGLIAEALRSIGIGEEPIERVSLSGGCIHDVRRVSFATGRSVVCKTTMEPAGAEQLEAESQGLQALHDLEQQPLKIPAVLGFFRSTDRAVLILEWLEPGSPTDRMWSQFGTDLATMHDLVSDRQYGFAASNFIGATRQINDWSDDWVSFNQECRFEPQIKWARDAGLLQAEEVARISMVTRSLDRHLPADPHPSLLHGDLWSGNLIPLADGPIGVIDPACSIGDGWADIAMMQLFGGIPSICFDAYAEARTSDDPPSSERLLVYQMYHLLNHVNLFGRGYVGQVMQIAESLA